MRDAFSKGLVELARQDQRVVLLTGDHGYALFDEFRACCPDQYINAGVAEQNMVGVAAGLARTGFRPIVYGLSAFVPIRVLEQIKLDVCHDGLPVTFIGDGAGFVYSHLGTSHQSTEDISCLRSVPAITIFSPADRLEMDRCIQLLPDIDTPVYLRMGKADLGDVHTSPLHFAPGELVEIKEGRGGSLHFIATGSMVRSALDASEAYPGSGVTSVPTIKPLVTRQVAALCRAANSIVVLEEHSVLGGLGAAICEIAAETHPTRICRIGVQDRFSELCGSYSYLLREHGLDMPAIHQRIKKFLHPTS